MLPGSIDMCTREGVSGGRLVDKYQPEGTSAPLGSCRPGPAFSTDCGNTGDLYCNSDVDNAQELCTCASATGVDTCNTYGKCVATPCSTCQTCLTALQPYLQQLQSLPADTTSATDVASTFEAFCSKPSVSLATASSCHQVAAYIGTTFRGYAGRRAGVLCSMLGKCRSDLANCSLASDGLNGKLDSCSAQGVAGGAQLADIRTVEGGFGMLTNESFSPTTVDSAGVQLLASCHGWAEALKQV